MKKSVLRPILKFMSNRMSLLLPTYASINSAFLVLSQWYMHLLARHLVKYVGMACPLKEQTEFWSVSRTGPDRHHTYLPHTKA